jgi:GNAT superfamily N-acetyltransferase
VTPDVDPAALRERYDAQLRAWVPECLPAGDAVVSAGWIRYVPGTEFATLWGGSTLPAWRGKGIYRALVAYRAHLAVRRGYPLLQVDPSDDSRPILERNGFIAIATTTPYVFQPA